MQYAHLMHPPNRTTHPQNHSSLPQSTEKRLATVSLDFFNVLGFVPAFSFPGRTRQLANPVLSSLCPGLRHLSSKPRLRDAPIKGQP
jgi:hypothetical protein